MGRWRRTAFRSRRRPVAPFGGLEPLEPRVLLSFTDVTSALFPGESAVAPVWGDYDNDGLIDAVDANGRLWHNDGGTFTPGIRMGGGDYYWGDFDNDGFLDLYTSISEGQVTAVFHNNDGTGGFTEIPVPTLGWTANLGAALGDFNGDGFLDIYHGGYEIWDGSANDAFPDQLFLSVPDASHPGGRGYVLAWQESTSVWGSRARGVTAADFDVDGDLDVYVSHYRLAANTLWVNDGSGSDFPFSDGTGTYGVDGGSGHAIGSAWGDLDSDGYLDLLAGNFAHSGQPESQVLLNQGPTGDYRFTNLGQRGIYWQESWSSPGLADFDNDGMLDLFFTALPSYGNYSKLFRNVGGPGNPQFDDVTSAQGIGSLGDNFVNWADFDNDGDLDLSTGDRILRNDAGNANNWLRIRLAGDGVTVNRSAIGAVVRVTAGDLVVTRQVESGTGQGNMNELTLHFGLGSHDGAVGVEVHWPDGTQSAFTTAPNQTVAHTQGTGGAPLTPYHRDFEDLVFSGVTAISGDWYVNSARRLRGTPDPGADAIALMNTVGTLPDAMWMGATMRGKDVGSPYKSNGVLIFGYAGPSDFKFAGAFFGAGEWRIGHVSDGQWLFDVQAADDLALETDYRVEATLRGPTVVLSSNGVEKARHTFAGGLGGTRVGMATHEADTVFDDLQVAPLAGLPYQETFAGDHPAGQLVHAGTWSINASHGYLAEPDAGANAVSLVHLADPLPQGFHLGAIIRPRGDRASRNGLLIFDYHGPADFKYAGAFADAGQWRIGHVSGTEWAVDVAIDQAIDINTDRAVGLLVDGADVALSVDGGLIATHAFVQAAAGGGIGVGTRDAVTVFDDLVIEPIPALPFRESFEDGQATFVRPRTGSWRVDEAGHFRGEPETGADAVALIDLAVALPETYTIAATLQGQLLDAQATGAVIVFDYRGPGTFRYAGAFFDAGQWRIGHVEQGTWYTDVSVEDAIPIQTDLRARLLLDGGHVTLQIDDQTVAGHAFGTPVLSGQAGVAAREAIGLFDDLVVLVPGALPLTEDFSDGRADHLDGPAAAWSIDEAGRYQATPPPGTHALSLVRLEEALPESFLFEAQLTLRDGGSDYWKNGLIIFDYRGPSDYKYAGAFVGNGKWRIGHVQDTDRVVAEATDLLLLDVGYDTALYVDGATAGLSVNGQVLLTHEFEQPLHTGLVGVAGRNAVAAFDDLAIRPPPTLPHRENFDAGFAPHFDPTAGNWSVSAQGWYRGSAPPGSHATALLALPEPLPDSYIVRSTARTTDGGGGFWKNMLLVFDHVAPDTFKYAGGFTGSNLWQIGHVIDGAWHTDASGVSAIDPDTDYALQLEVDGGRATLTVDGREQATHVFAGPVNGGRIGVGARNAVALFDDLAVIAAVPLPAHEDFDHGDTGIVRPVQGTWSVDGAGRLLGMAEGEGASAGLLWLADPLPARFAIEAAIDIDDGPSWDNGLVLFDYQGPDQYRYAGGFVGADEWRIGHVTASVAVTDAVAGGSVDVNRPYSVRLVIEGGRASLAVDGVAVVAHDYGEDDPLNGGALGVGTRRGVSRFDDLRVTALPPVVTVTPMLTNDTTPDLEGTIDDPTASVTVSVGGVTHSAFNHGDGYWSLSGLVLGDPLDEGVHDVLVRATGAGGAVGTDDTTDELTIDTTAPTVRAVWLNGTTWTQPFRDALDPAAGPGAGRGHAVPTGSPHQFDPLPWATIDQVMLVFSEHVLILGPELSISGTGLPAYDIDRFDYDPTTFTATWTLTGAPGTDRLRLDLADTVIDPAGNRVDGEWTDGQSQASGDGRPGGRFAMALHVVVGDTSGDGVTSIRDLLALRRSLGSAIGDGAYSVLADLNGDGRVDGNDAGVLRAFFGRRLPPALP